MKNRISILIDWSKHLTLPGFRGMNSYDVGSFFLKGLIEGALTTRASSIAFNFFLALFPALIFFFTLIPYIPIENFQETLLQLLVEVLPPSTNEIAYQTVKDIVNNQRGNLLSVGFLMALIFSTNSISSLMEAFNSSYHITESRDIWRQRLVALALTILLALMLILAIVLIIFSEYLSVMIDNIDYLKDSTVYMVMITKWIILLLFLFFGLSILYQYAPSRKNHWNFFSPGGIIATLFIVITSLGFGFYIDHFAQYNKLYGSIGTLIVILLWMYFNAIVILIGFELNASIYNAQKKLS